MTHPECPACPDRAGHRQDGCVLAALMDIVAQRGALSSDEMMSIWEHCDGERLWEDLGPIVDKLETGGYDA